MNSCLPKYQRDSALAYSLFLSRGLWTKGIFSEKENSMESLGSRLLKENTKTGTSSRLSCPIKEILTFLSWLWPLACFLSFHIYAGMYFNSQKRGYYHQDTDHIAEGSSGWTPAGWYLPRIRQRAQTTEQSKFPSYHPTPRHFTHTSGPEKLHGSCGVRKKEKNTYNSFLWRKALSVFFSNIQDVS